MDYAAYLTTKHWKQVAHAARARARGQCALSSFHRGELHVHHRNYLRLGHELPEDVIVLCWRCHARFHGTFDECIAEQLHLPLMIPHGAELN